MFQLNTNVCLPEEMRLAAKFLTDMAELRERMTAPYRNLGGNAVGGLQSAQPEVAQNTGNSEPAADTHVGDPVGQQQSAAVGAPPTSTAAPAVTEKRGRGRPRKNESEAAANAEAEEASDATPPNEQAPAEPAQESAQSITIDQLRDALQTFTQTNGMEGGMALLAEFGARRISEMVEKPEAEKAKFIDACNKGAA